MKSFRTPLPAKPSNQQISLSDRILTLGSCFAGTIGTRLEQSKIETSVNPFGVIYNPVSIHKLIGYALSEGMPAPDTFLEHDGISLNYDFHSGLSSPSRTGLEAQIASTITTSHAFLHKTKWILITYGTAWAYEHVDTGAVVANCHKQTAHAFKKNLLGADQVVASFRAMHQRLLEFNPGVRIILTVSPVRHLKDTLELNSVSKSILRLACHEIQQTFDSVHYFPAYEIMLDDLRDYRFYQKDMIHPSEEAEDYIWNHFADTYFDQGLLKFMDTWQSIRQGLQHRPFHPESAGHQKFLRDLLTKLELLKTTVDVGTEIRDVTSRLVS